MRKLFLRLRQTPGNKSSVYLYIQRDAKQKEVTKFFFRERSEQNREIKKKIKKIKKSRKKAKTL